MIQQQIDLWESILDHGKQLSINEVLMVVGDLKSTLIYKGPSYTSAFEKLFKSAQSGWKK